MARSVSWIAVGSPSTDPRLHAASQSAGHTRLVNSGSGVREREPRRRLVPAPLPDEVVPLGDEVVERAAARPRVAEGDAGLAEGHAAHHAAARLDALLLLVDLNVERVEIPRALIDVAQAVRDAPVRQERSRLSHRYRPPFPR